MWPLSGSRDDHAEAQREVRDVRERLPRPDGERRQRREDHAAEVLGERLALGRARVGDALDDDAVLRERGQQQLGDAAREPRAVLEHALGASSSSVCDGVRPSIPGRSTPASIWSCSPATRTMKNSSRLRACRSRRTSSRSSSGSEASSASSSTRMAMGSCLLLTGCIQPHYHNHQLVVFGKAAPAISGPLDPTIAYHLRTKPSPRVELLTAITAVVTTPFKCIGVQGWKDFHMHAEAHGALVQARISSDGFLSADLRLDSLTVDGVAVPVLGTRYIRVEVFLSNVSVDKTLAKEEQPYVITEGKFVWDTDGWFEIHPQATGDFRRDRTRESPPPTNGPED